ncbi:MAG: peptide deformylase [Clostridia bacterium]|mgnify:FL=1|jgi:peptide deformylase|nr:peptide deformylase [Clostridia bacterium]
MAIRNIITGENTSALRKCAREVKNINKRTTTLLDDMKETMNKQEGVGLAAPQVGVLRRIAVVGYEDEYFELINPNITKSCGECVDDEGCLSVPGVRGLVKRPQTITVEYLDRDGKLQKKDVSDTMARIFCHEIDHLDGVLFVDNIVEPEDVEDIQDEEESTE